MSKLTGLIIALVFSCNAAATSYINDFRIWSAPAHSKVVFELSSPPAYNIKYERELDSITINLNRAGSRIFIDHIVENDPRIEVIKTRIRKDKFIVIVDLKARIRVSSFIARPNDKYNYRLIVDIKDDKLKTRPRAKSQGFLVAIDAGHGGEDPGAVGESGVYEKNIALDIANKLKKLLDEIPGIKPVLTRIDDYSLSLRERVNIANSNRADLFLSVHANKFINSQINGASVFVQSQIGASSPLAKEIAKTENEVDNLGGIDEKAVAAGSLEFVLQDLAISANKKLSKKAASIIIREMGKVARLHSNQVQHAGFLVLRKARMPAVLVEAGFVSNADEEERLQQESYQEKLARALAKAVRIYQKTATN